MMGYDDRDDPIGNVLSHPGPSDVDAGGRAGKLSSAVCAFQRHNERGTWKRESLRGQR
jgi:hypothetical protein